MPDGRTQAEPRRPGAPRGERGWGSPGSAGSREATGLLPATEEGEKTRAASGAEGGRSGGQA